MSATSTSAASSLLKHEAKYGSQAGRGYWVLTIAGLFGAWLVKDAAPYAPGSDFGYYLGLVGGIAMLVLLLYPVRKRIRLLHNLFPLKYWFRAHMFLGVFGPLLIVFHSKLHLASINAAVAFACMLAVFLSGLVGRFIYTKIHHGLYGRRTTREELKQRLGMNAQEVRSRFHCAPKVEERLNAFEARVLRVGGTVWHTMQFFTLPFKTLIVFLSAARTLNAALAREASKRGWDTARSRAARRQGRRILKAYLGAVQAEAQFAAYERLFSLWHVLHVPLVFLLIITGVIHVIAVHMY